MTRATLDPASSGVYSAPQDLDALKAAAEHARLEWLAVDLAGARGKADLLAACARDLAFPDTFGGNWDALADCLQDLSWRPAPGYVVQLVDAQGLAAAARPDLDTALEILRDAATYWKERGKAFIVLAGREAALPAFRAVRGYKKPVSVLVVVYTPDLRVLLLERADRPGFWQSVTGSQDEGESLEQTAMREVREETGLDARDFELTDWRRQNEFEIYPHWRHRYAPGVTRNTEHVFGLRVPAERPVTVAEREHLNHVWLPWREAADKVFSWSNAEAIRELPARAAGE